MTTPPELLEHSLEVYGDTLYRAALIAAGDEGRAAALLRELAAGIGRAQAAPEAAPPALDEPALLARLVAAARAAEAAEAAHAPRRQRQPRANLFAPFALHHLGLDQRMALGLHLLLGYDGPRLAAVLGLDTPVARAALIEAARALGPAAGHALTDRVTGEACAGVRAILADASAGSRHSAAVRGHLSACAPCRAFDHAWGAILTAVEEALRGALRERTLPDALRARMLALATPRARRRAPAWRFTRLALVPAGVLALIVAIALPGFLRQPVSVVERDAGPPIDVQALIARALERHTNPPARGGVWHGRYETLWYFNDEVYAPLRADIWLDPRNPARHRLQLAHRDGGAPYELQIGDGEGRLAYALDASYAPSLYGALPTGARVERPALADQPLDVTGQLRARDERLHAGPWSIPPSYLRQAQLAEDLRLLGRQRDGGRVVQILSFSGVSPLGIPPDAPGATAERVTVLLALDSEDGLLRSATELAGPSGAAQTGRITWRLVEEQWLSDLEHVREAFSPERAWTGIGDFSEVPRAPGADPALPLLAARAVGDPAGLLSMGRLPFWMPRSLPPGVDRALLVWGERERQRGEPPQGLVYLGEGRRLTMAFNSSTALDGESLVIGPWRVTLRASRGQRYTAVLSRPEARPELAGRGLFDPSATALLDATGFTRDELEALIASMAPFDLEALAAQEGLFVTPGVSDAAARAALIEAAHELARIPEGQALRLRSRWYVRQAPELTDPRRDPYHRPPYEGRPEVTDAEEWLRGDGQRLAFYLELRDPDDGAVLRSRYTDGERLWRYSAPFDALDRWPPLISSYTIRLPMPAATALDLLSQPGELSLERRPGGGRLVRHSEPARSSSRYGQSVAVDAPAEPHLYDLAPSAIVTEVELGPGGEAVAVRIYAESDGGPRTLVESYEVLDREAVPLDQAPAALREGAAPDAAVVRELSLTPREAARLIERDALDDVVGWPGVPIYAPAEGAATLLAIEEGDASAQGPGLDYSAFSGGDLLREAVVRRLAVRTSYRAPAGEYDPATSFDLTITQGPAAPLATFLRSSPDVPWGASEPIALSVAGREVEGWYAPDRRTHLIFELGETLLIVDSSRPPDDPALRALLAGLSPVP